MSVTENSNERKAAVEQLYFTAYGTLSNLIHEAATLSAVDVSHIITGIGAHLDSYMDTLTPEAFESWAIEIARPLIDFYELYRSYGDVVKAAIWSVLKGCADLGIDAETIPSIEDRTWMSVFTNLDEWLVKGTAKITTRLWAMAKLQALGWRKTRLRELERLEPLETLMRVEHSDSSNAA